MLKSDPYPKERKKKGRRKSQNLQLCQVYGNAKPIKLLNIPGEMKTYHDLQIQKGR